MNSIVSLGKDFYLTLVKKSCQKVKNKHQKIIFLLSFPSTSHYLLQKIYEKFEDRLIICYTNDGQILAENYQKKGCTIYALDHLPTLFKKVIPMVKGSRVILCDNYYAFLAGMSFDNETSVVQVWHANGAIKLFGLNAHYTKDASMRDHLRYSAVYQKFTHYMISSAKMETIFAANYQQPVTGLRFGYAPTDYYFDEEWLCNVRRKFAENFSENKKVVLYVPTYREKTLNIPLTFSKMASTLGEEWLILVKAHPHDHELQTQLDPTVITDFKGLTLQEILPSVDCLITDYSSVPFEYSLANPEGKIIFFCYDLFDYQKTVGIEADFIEWAPGKIVQNEYELIQEIKNPMKKSLHNFNQIWNEYAQGNAAEQLIEWVERKYED